MRKLVEGEVQHPILPWLPGIDVNATQGAMNLTQFSYAKQMAAAIRRMLQHMPRCSLPANACRGH